MKKVLIGCLGLVVVLVIAAVVAVFSLPSEFSVTREKTMAGTPDAAYAIASDLHDWPEWTFWSRAGDPTATWDFSGEAGTPGHSMKWKGDTWGEGEIVLTECIPGDVLKYELTFYEGGEGETSTGAIEFSPAGDGTKVVWMMEGEMSGVGKLFGLVIDAMIGPMFEVSLDGLEDELAKAPAEGAEGAEAPAEGE